MARFAEIPDHPEIAYALRTGYPKPVKFVKCADCGEEFTGDHRMYISDGDLVCGNCLWNRIEENYDSDDLAEAFDIERTTAGSYVEEQEERLRMT